MSVRLANFLIHDNVGQGEMGSIYRATDEALGREVAIKLLRGSYDGDPEACERLRKEACALGRLNLSRVAQVYALSFSNGHPYLVMELVTGEDFERKVHQEGHLDERVVLRMAGDVAEGLAALNREGLVHSDIKPANIVMDRDGNSKLVDFGLTGMTRYDANHNLMGTPDYMAPELISGAPDSQSSDIFSLGATLYHLLSGRTPTPGENPKEVLKARIDNVPTTPLKEVAPWVSTPTCKCVMKMLEYRPEDRVPNSDILLYQIKESLRFLDAPQVPDDGFGMRPDLSFPPQENASLLSPDEKGMKSDNEVSPYGQLAPSEPRSLAPPEAPVKNPKRVSKKVGRLFLWLFLILGAWVAALQYPPCKKVWNLYYNPVANAVTALAKRHVFLAQALSWSGQKVDEFQGLISTMLGTATEDQRLLSPPLSVFRAETSQAWRITNMGDQTKNGSAMQTGEKLAIQLLGVAVDTWASWQNGYKHGRFIGSKTTADCYAFSAHFDTVATRHPMDVTGLQIKGSDASEAPWVFFGFLGNGELFFQVRFSDGKTRVLKSLQHPSDLLRYLMIVRRGSSFEALHSSEGRRWVPFARGVVDLPVEHVAGFFVATRDPGQYATVKLDSMQLKVPEGHKKL